MSKHEELIKSLRASAAGMPFDAAVAVQYRAAAGALEAQALEIEGLRKDAERWRWAITPSDAQAAFAERLYRSFDSKDGWDSEADAAMGSPHG